MTLLLICLCFVLASAAVSVLPLRFQMLPGLALMGCGPALILFMWQDNGLWAGIAALAVYLSIFRNPILTLLRGLWIRLRGTGPS